jgi:hypothetical protein
MAKTIWKTIALTMGGILAACAIYAAGYTDMLDMKGTIKWSYKERYRR